MVTQISYAGMINPDCEMSDPAMWRCGRFWLEVLPRLMTWMGVAMIIVAILGGVASQIVPSKSFVWYWGSTLAAVGLLIAFTGSLFATMIRSKREQRMLQQLVRPAPYHRKRTPQNNKDSKPQPTPDADPKDVGNEEMTEAAGDK
jgi:hypothetical protein